MVDWFLLSLLSPAMVHIDEEAVMNRVENLEKMDKEVVVEDKDYIGVDCFEQYMNLFEVVSM